LKFSIFGGKDEESIDEEELNEYAQQISSDVQEVEPGPETNESAYDEIRENLEDLRARVEQIDSASSALRSELGQFDQRFNSIENNVREMLSLYEIATKNQNPFFQPSSSGGETATDATESTTFSNEDGMAKISQEGPGSPDTQDDSPSDRFSESDLGASKLGLPRLEDVREDRPLDTLTCDDLDNSPVTNMLLLRWIEYIMQKVGYTGLSSTLEYYVQIEWISQDAARKIMAFSTGIDPNGADAGVPKKATLTVREHLVSLFFVNKLKKEEVFDNIYVSVKDEVEKLGLSLSSESA
jgi:flagellar protein FlaD